MVEARDTRSNAALSASAGKVLEDFLADLEARGVTKKTLQTYGSYTRIFLRWLDQLDPVQVDVNELKGFKKYLEEERKSSPKTMMTYFSGLQSFYEFLVFDGRLKVSPVLSFRKRYLRAMRRDAMKDRSGLRQVLDIPDTRRLVHSMMDVRDQAVLTLSLKTGIRREELISIDVEDIDWVEQSIVLKPKPKRTNTLVFFDDETARLLVRWMGVRAARGGKKTGPLFINQRNQRLGRNGVYYSIRTPAEAAGLHDAEGSLKQKFTPHACRHWFTTHLRRAGMSREHLAWLRGDAPAETMDIYMQIDPKAVRESYRACIPQLDL